MAARARALLGSIIFFLVAPGTVAGVVPWWISRWEVQPPFLGVSLVPIVGALLIVAGVVVLLDSFARFAIQGLGTPAPIAPTRHLVVTGLYRYVRNPIYLGLVAAIFGQGLLLGSVRLVGYGAFVWLACHIFVLAYEEPTLQRTFGIEYDAYRGKVPRWMPLLHPWRRTSERK